MASQNYAVKAYSFFPLTQTSFYFRVFTFPCLSAFLDEYEVCFKFNICSIIEWGLKQGSNELQVTN